MSEIHDRCSYWPNCRIHLGLARPRHFTTSNLAEMQQMRREGFTLAEIAATFGSHINYIAKITTRRP